jgi:hypothetical protein
MENEKDVLQKSNIPGRLRRFGGLSFFPPVIEKFDAVWIVDGKFRPPCRFFC